MAMKAQTVRQRTFAMDPQKGTFLLPQLVYLALRKPLCSSITPDLTRSTMIGGRIWSIEPYAELVSKLVHYTRRTVSNVSRGSDMRGQMPGWVCCRLMRSREGAKDTVRTSFNCFLITVAVGFIPLIRIQLVIDTRHEFSGRHCAVNIMVYRPKFSRYHDWILCCG